MGRLNFPGAFLDAFAFLQGQHAALCEFFTRIGRDDGCIGHSVASDRLKIE